MLTEQQIQPPVTATGNAPQPQSANQKNRNAAGSVPAPAASRTSPTGCSKASRARRLLRLRGRLTAVLVGLLKSKKEKTRMDALIFPRDTMIGRPTQNVQLSGGVLHADAWRPLASLSDDEMEMLDKLTKKLAGPVLDIAQDAPQNQIGSKPASEAEGDGAVPALSISNWLRGSDLN